MRAKTLTTVVFASLMTLGGAALADGSNPHSAYDRAFLGKSDAKPTVATSAMPTRASKGEGHAAYDRAFLGPNDRSQPMDSMGAMGRSADSMGRGSGIEGFIAYHRAFRGD